MTTFRQLLEQFEDSARTRAAKGRAFEVFCEAFFQADPFWRERFEKVWSWMDWPGRQGLADTGIDLVAQERGTGDLVAIQCKFYSPNASLSWSHVATFAGMLSHSDFARGMIVSTAGTESPKVHQNLERLGKPVQLWRVADFEESRVDWDQFRVEEPARLALQAPKVPFRHQTDAIHDVLRGFEENDRGQLIMACGTGKTFTALQIAEHMAGPGGSVLFLMPSINLLSQSVLAWSNDATVPLATFAVCSDSKAGQRRSDDDISINDLAFPASTNVHQLTAQIAARSEASRMTVVFSTYQSIDVIRELQQGGHQQFDLIICDEAHRTTGAFSGEDDQSAFTKVHDDELVKGTFRLYMTATPRIYGDQAKNKAAANDILVASMDDESLFGPEFHNLSFGDAVARELLTDYKVLVLAVNEDTVAQTFQNQFAGGELPLNDMARLVGCWHGLSKRGPQFGDDNVPMQRAVAFSSTIAQSKAFANAFPQLVNTALENRRDSNAVKIEASHVDGTTNVKVRSEAIAWLEEPPGQRVCRVLSNAKCLTEGVDVPALDAVMFLNPRKSIVDVVQAVGRVMRRSPGKEYGYVILPIGIPHGVTPEEALRDHKSYQVVWQVLQALRSHDERLAAEINKIDINGSSSKVNIIGVGISGGADVADPDAAARGHAETTLDLPDLQAWCDALYAKIVEKVGDRRYMEAWAADISAIAASQEIRIRALLAHPDQNRQAVERFQRFLAELRESLNDGITRDDAIGMLSQHLITRPVFDALFGGEAFTRRNPVSLVMQEMIETLDKANVDTETVTLERFYEHIRMLIGDINTDEGRQRVITELYEKFFKKALPKTAESLGIVYTPIEIVDFINRSVDELLNKHFNGTRITDQGVHVLDPFTGTGTFIARLLQSGLIKPNDLERKYKNELHANEIMLLAYYIAAINIETIYANTANKGAERRHLDYEPFNGIVLTDTFTLTEDQPTLDRKLFATNNKRAEHQQSLDIRVILGNPPYSVGQSNQNDDNQNLKYPTVDASIEGTYARRSTRKLKNSLYDSYVRAFRWASDRLAESPTGGIIGFVSNNGWLDSNTADGIRHTFNDEFHHIYIYNLRGNSRMSGDIARREGGNVFNVRVGVAITFLVRQPDNVPLSGARIHYFDIGDYRDRDEKLEIIQGSAIEAIEWEHITPNSHADWINQRDERYDRLIPLSGDGGIFHLDSNGLKTNRDAWVYNSSLRALNANVEAMIDFYNAQCHEFNANAPITRTIAERSKLASEFVDRDPRRFSWDRADFARMASNMRYELKEGLVRRGLYRPFMRQHVAFDRTVNNETYKLPSFFPVGESTQAIAVQQTGPAPFSVLGVNTLIDLVGVCGAGNPSTVYARWRYEIPEGGSLLSSSNEVPQRYSNMQPTTLAKFHEALGHDITEDDLFAYVYGVMHSPQFREVFGVNLKKEGPRVPMAVSRDVFDAFAKSGEELLDLHIGFDEVDPFPLVENWRAGSDPDSNPELLLVGDRRMRYPKISDPDTGDSVADRSRLIYNDHLTLEGIPLRAHDYMLGTRSGIDWIIDRWYIKTDKASGIVNDVNQWGLEQGQPRYIIDLIKRVVTVSTRTVDIVDALPDISF